MAWGAQPNPRPYFTGGANTFSPPPVVKVPTVAFKPLPVPAPSKVIQTALGTAFMPPIPQVKTVLTTPGKAAQSFPPVPPAKSAAETAKAAAAAAQKAAEEKIKTEAAAKLEAARKALMASTAAAKSALSAAKPGPAAAGGSPTPAPAPAASTAGMSNTALVVLAAVGLFFALPWIRKAF